MLQRRSVTSAALALVLASVLVACGDDDDESPPPPAPSVSATATPGASPSASATAGVPQRPANEMGVADGKIIRWTLAQLDARLGQLKAAGAEWFRLDVEWRAGEPRRGRYNWKVYDSAIAAITRHGLKPLIVVGYASEWSSGEADCASKLCAPAPQPWATQAYADFVFYTVQHYSEAPFEVPAIELWNEPNSVHYWPGANAAHYTEVLKLAYTAAKRANPNITVLPGGLGDSRRNSHNIRPLEFLRGIYAAGGKGHFDAVSMHPYVSGSPLKAGGSDAWGQMLAIHELMVANGDGAKQVWITEFGYETDAVSPAAQAAYLRQAVERFRSYPWAGPFFWFRFEDPANIPDDHFGLHDRAGKPRPAFKTFADLAKN